MVTPINDCTRMQMLRVVLGIEEELPGEDESAHGLNFENFGW